ncbi:BZ3500_MvSof-1268-A1-R1_Chr5-2g07900 [Microbotryum saponariae]|uniref:BZ3500_MvSof-1268-A1-R1_Chr5-2g07900 protein n=1 Tax=Microbotryum saponariae TaxID=289078 RepID=A0A2X0KG11_9BASI|nr:BZ3500_MvSof-1268-A1-R1_Chr5-2g07900 [Microbotryum saponariae]SDA05769.1 BZ3501_MvSof-1269-A2-R1_Chr5-2g07722 [Microbotryum saponariae]
MGTPLRNGKAPSSTLLGTPLPPRERSTGAPSPSPSIMSRHNKSSIVDGGEHVVTSPFGRGTSMRRFILPTPHPDSTTAPASPTPTATATSTVAGSDYEKSVIEHTAPTATPARRPTASSAPIRIVADPSIATTFRRDEDPELYDLFLR